jgi:hypothetical protein
MDTAGGLDSGISVASCGGGATMGISSRTGEWSFVEVDPWVTRFRPESAWEGRDTFFGGDELALKSDLGSLVKIGRWMEGARAQLGLVTV